MASTLADIGAGLLQEVFMGPAHIEILTQTSFEVPGIDEALKSKNLDAPTRKTLEMVNAEPGYRTEIEQINFQNKRSLITPLQKGVPKGRACTVIEIAGSAWYARDGKQFAALGSTKPVAETEQAFPALLEVRLPTLVVEYKNEGYFFEAEIEEQLAHQLIDLKHVAGKPGEQEIFTKLSGSLTAERIDIELSLIVRTSSHSAVKALGEGDEELQAASAALEHSEQKLQSKTTSKYTITRLTVPPLIEAPLPSLSGRPLKSLHQFFSEERSPQPKNRRKGPKTKQKFRFGR